MVPEIQIPAAFEVLFRPKRIKVFFGGRGSGKSESVGRAALIKAEQTQGFSVLCSRMFQNYIEDSVVGMLNKFIEEYQIPFESLTNEIRTPLGGRFRFQGLARNITSLKSKFGYDWLWVEEAEDVPSKVWDVLIPTLRKGGSEIIVTFNPKDEMDDTYQEFVAPYIDTIRQQGFYEDEHIYVALVNYESNPFFPEELRKESDRLKKRNYKKWLHVYGGEPNVDYEDSMIEPEWFDAAVDAHVKLNIIPRGERVTGFDPADTGTDAKARCNRLGILIDDVKSWTTGDITTGTQLAVDDAQDWRASQLIYDNIGNGAAVKTYASMGGKPAGLEFVGFGAADTPDYPDQFYDDPKGERREEKGDRTNRNAFKNKRAQYWWLLRDRFYRTYKAVVDGEYHDPDTLISINGSMAELKKLKSELIKVQRVRRAGLKVIQVESKDDMRKRGVPSPNLADSLMMSFAAAEVSSYKYEKRSASGRR